MRSRLGSIFVLVLAGAVVAHAQTPSQENVELWNEHTVMIDTPDTQGAGIIVAFESNLATVVTANHIVRPLGTLENQVDVRFFGIEGKFPAQVETLFSPEDGLDLAILRVRVDDTTATRLYGLTFSILPPADFLPSPGKKAFPLGYPLNNPWQRTETPCVLADAGPRITFESCTIRPGNSGGGMFAQDGYLLGLVMDMGLARAAHVLDIRQIVAQLDKWRVQTQLKAQVDTGSNLATGTARVQTSSPIDLRIEAWPNGRFVIAGSSSSRGPVYEYSTDGKTFVPLGRTRRDIAMPSPPLLIVREIDRDSGSEVSRVDRTAFLKTELTRQIKEIIPEVVEDVARGGAHEWGCTLYGCRFNESYGKQVICSAAVSRVLLGESTSDLSFVLDRSGCKSNTDAGNSGELIVCAQFPRLPFSVAPGKTIYAKFEFIDGTSHVEPFAIDTRVLGHSVVGVMSESDAGFDRWTFLTPVGDSNDPKGRVAPPAAIMFEPDEVVPGSAYFTFVGIQPGLKNCLPREGSINTNELSERWLLNINGTGFKVSQRYGIAVNVPHYGGLYNEQIVPPETAAALTKVPTELQIAFSSDELGQLGPYKYRFDPTAPVVSAMRQKKPPHIACVRASATSPVICGPGDMDSFIDIKEVRFGSKAADASHVVPVNYPVADYLAQHFDWQRRGEQRPAFSFQVPGGWSEAFAQIVDVHGKVLGTDRVALEVVPVGTVNAQ